MVSKRQKRALDEDPLARAIAPPPNETSAERELRIAAELEAKRVSDAIDEELNRQRVADKKYPKPVKLLLLGASTFALAVPRRYNRPPFPWQARANLVCVHLMVSLSPLIFYSIGKSTTLKSR